MTVELNNGDTSGWVKRQIELAKNIIDRTIDSGQMREHYAAHDALKHLRAIESIIAANARLAEEAEALRTTLYALQQRWRSGADAVRKDPSSFCNARLDGCTETLDECADELSEAIDQLRAGKV